MAKMCCRTKGNAIPAGKRRVYFTCHPDDFDNYFEKVCADIFKTHDCAIFYTQDMGAEIEAQHRETDLESNNLFVVPVTFKLLTTPNRAMDADIPFALQKHIPVLPLVMESGIDGVYAQPDKFGELQYLNPYSTDTTEIPYEEKLKRHLESVLTSDETASRIRTAFSAYIFLSYRKKDRRYANELMRLIHGDPHFNDIAIWYDEFLTPGESFRDNIEHILKDCKLFALLVTPNLLEEPDGKPNFVIAQEYPAARNCGIVILPVEMEKTDQAALQQAFKDIPPCIDPYDKSFSAHFFLSVRNIASVDINMDPMHNYLIGLAYLNGIDVEVDRKRGLDMISYAAASGLPEAMDVLCRMYHNGIGVAQDHRKAAQYAQGIYDCYCNTFGKEDPRSLAALHNLAFMLEKLGALERAQELYKIVLVVRKRVLGKEHPDTLATLNNLACTYSRTGDHKNALELHSVVYLLQQKVLGSQHAATVTAMANLAYSYSKLGDHASALELEKAVYAVRKKFLGEEHASTVSALANLALTYNSLGDHKKAMELLENAYMIRCKVLGQTHPSTVRTKENILTLHSLYCRHCGGPFKGLFRKRCKQCGKPKEHRS